MVGVGFVSHWVEVLRFTIKVRLTSNFAHTVVPGISTEDSVSSLKMLNPPAGKEGSAAIYMGCSHIIFEH